MKGASVVARGIIAAEYGSAVARRSTGEAPSKSASPEQKLGGLDIYCFAVKRQHK